MLRILILIVALIFHLSTHSQKNFAHELQLTETKFALESQIYGLKWGFLHNMDTAALGLYPQGFINLYKAWDARPQDVGFDLLWEPKSVFWSTNGLFGITNGPFYVRVAKDSGLTHGGYFFTIWQRKNLNEPFKISADVGISVSTPGVMNSLRDATVKHQSIAHGQGKNKTAAFNEFTKLAVASTLKQAIANYANEKTNILVANVGVLSKSELDQSQKLNGKYQFEKLNTRSLSASCYYEWGKLREADKHSGYFVHVWSLESAKPLLIAAVYRFD